MALRSFVPQRNGKRVPLTRSGGKSAPGKNVRQEPKKAAPKAAMPDSTQQGQSRYSRLGMARDFFSATLFIAMVLFFIGTVGLGLTYSYRSLISGNYFALKTLEIQGNFRLSSREILEIADLTKGGNTLALSIDAVEESLIRHPWVEAVSVKRVLPGTLIIGVREKTPAFWVLSEGILHYADARGRLIAPVIPGNFASLPTLEVEPGAEGTAASLPDLVKSLQESRLPLNMDSISLVRLTSARDVELHVDDAQLKIFIDIEGWTSNLRRLGRTLSDLERRDELGTVRAIRAQSANVWVERRAGFTSAQRNDWSDWREEKIQWPRLT